MLSSHESLGDINRVSGIGAARDEHFLIVSSRYISKRIHYRELTEAKHYDYFYPLRPPHNKVISKIRFLTI